MSSPELVIAQSGDGEFAAASTGAAYFCTVGDSAEAVRARAAAALEFYRSIVVQRTPITPRIRPAVVRLVPYETEAWLADNALSA